MANVTKIDGKFISILLDGNTDWDLETEYYPEHPEAIGKGIKVSHISFHPTAADDSIVIRNTPAANQTSPEIMRTLAASKYDIPRVQFNGGEGKWMEPAMDAADLTVAAMRVIIELADNS